MSLLTAGIFLSNTVFADVGMGDSRGEVTSPLRTLSPVQKIEAVTFDVPLNLGTVTDFHQGANGKTVIHIQDAHCNYSCQRSTEGLICYFNDRYGVDTVALEGGAGKYDLSLFTDIKDKAIREKVADHFLKEGRLNGAEFFAVNNPGKITLKGLEDPDLYLENLKVYREGLKDKPIVNRTLDAITVDLSRLKARIYSARLNEFEEKQKAYADKKIELSAYIGYLVGLSDEFSMDREAYKSLCGLMRVIEKEKAVDFKCANTERDELVNELTGRVSKEEFDVIVRKTLEFKQGVISQTQFYAYLFSKAKTSDVDIAASYLNLTKYKQYIDTYASIDTAVLFTEIEKFEDAIAEKLFQNNDQRGLYGRSKWLTLLKGLFDITLTRDMYDRYVSFRHCEESRDAGRRSNLGLDRLSEAVLRMERFYDLAFKRDEAFVRNIELFTVGAPLVGALKDRAPIKDAPTVVITGGFHAENLKKLLREKGYSYVSIMPKIDGDDPCPYQEILSGGLTHMERTIKAAFSLLQVPDIWSDLGQAGNPGLKDLEGIKAMALRLMFGAKRPVAVKISGGRYLVVEEQDGCPVTSIKSDPGDAEIVSEQFLKRSVEEPSRIMQTIDACYDRWQRAGRIRSFLESSQGGAFGPSKTSDVEDVAGHFLADKPGTKVLDLGSGTGKAVSVFSHYAGYVKGIEILEKLSVEAEWCLKELGDMKLLGPGRIELECGDIFARNVDFSEYDLIYIYFPYDLASKAGQAFAKRLENKLSDEMKPGAVFVLNYPGELAHLNSAFPKLKNVNTGAAFWPYIRAYEKPGKIPDTNANLGRGVGVLFTPPSSVGPQLYESVGKLFEEYPAAKELYEDVAGWSGYTIEDLRLHDYERQKHDTTLLNLASILYPLVLYRALEARAGHPFKPEILSGNSGGALTAMIVSGAITLKEITRFVIETTRWLTQMQERHDWGYLVVMGGAYDTIKPYLAANKGRIEVVNVVSPDYMTIAVKNETGDGERFQEYLSGVAAEIKRGYEAQHEKVKIKAAYPPAYKGPHHTFFPEYIQPVHDIAASLEINPPQVPIVSPSQPGVIMDSADAVRAELANGYFRAIYWDDAIRTMTGVKPELFLEIGPGRRLADFNKRLARDILTVNLSEANTIGTILSFFASRNEKQYGDDRHGPVFSTFVDAEGGVTLTGRTYLPPYRPVTMRITPQPKGHGIVIRMKKDLNGGQESYQDIPVREESVSQTTRTIVLSNKDASFTGPEHLLAALYVLGIDNALIEVDGNCAPMMSYNTETYVRGLMHQEWRGQTRQEEYEITEPFIVYDGQGRPQYIVLPHDGLKISYLLDYDNPVIGRQWESCEITPESFLRDIAPARSFVFDYQLQALERIMPGMRDLCLTDPEGPVVIGKDAIVSPGYRLHSGHDQARHKIGDLVGDLRLAQRRVKAHIISFKTGHAENRYFARELDARINGRGDPALSLEEVEKIREQVRATYFPDEQLPNEVSDAFEEMRKAALRKAQPTDGPATSINQRPYKGRVVGAPNASLAIPTDVDLARSGIDALHSMMRRLPATFDRRVVGNLVFMYAGVQPTHSLPSSIMNDDEREVFVAAVCEDQNFTVVEGEVINLEAASRTIKLNKRYFPEEAQTTPADWLRSHARDWSRNNAAPEAQIRYGLLSGYPVTAAANFPVYLAAEEKIPPKALGTRSAGKLRGYGLNEKEIKAYIRHYRAAILGVGDFIGFDRDYEGRWADAISDIVATALPAVPEIGADGIPETDSLPLPTNSTIAKQGLADLRHMIKNLPKNFDPELIANNPAVMTALMGVNPVRSLEDLSCMTKREKRIFYGAIEASGRYKIIKGNLVNIESVSIVMRENPKYFSEEAIAEPVKWLEANAKDYMNGNDTRDVKPVVRYGLLSGFPKASAELYCDYINGIMKVPNEFRNVREKAMLMSLGLNEREAVAVAGHHKGFYRWIGGFVGLDKDYDQKWANAITRIMLDALPSASDCPVVAMALLDLRSEAMSAAVVDISSTLETDNNKAMQALHIKDTAARIFARLTASNKDIPWTPAMSGPCTIGMVIKANPKDDVDAILKQHLAKEWEIFGRKVTDKISVERSVRIGNITYVACVDDGTDACLRTFKERLEKAGNPKERTFAWVISNDERKKQDNAAMKDLNNTANLVGIDGEFIPVSWQMLAGPLFVNLINQAGKPEAQRDQAKIDSLADAIVRSIAEMERRPERAGLKSELRRASIGDLAEKFNGIELIVDLPPIGPESDSVENLHRADKEFQSSL